MPATTNKERVDIAELLRLEAERLRILDLKAITRAGSGHPGGTLSLAEAMATLFFGGVLRYDPQDPAWPNPANRVIITQPHQTHYQAATQYKAVQRSKIRNINS